MKLLHHFFPVFTIKRYPRSGFSLSSAASPPSFAENPLRNVLKVRAGGEVTLDCRPQASPKAVSLWKRGNELIQKNER